DTTIGDNTWSVSLNRFFAVPGYDLCTGLGIPNGTNLINALTSVAGQPRIEFASPNYTVNDATPGFAPISVVNVAGVPGTVVFATSDGTAISGFDYLNRNGTLTFVAGQTSMNFDIIILDNARKDSKRAVILSLFNPSGPAVLGALTNAPL